MVLEFKEGVKQILKYRKNSNDNDTDLQKNAEQMKRSWYREFGWDEEPIIRNDQKDALERSWNILVKNCDCCISNGITPVIVILPSNCHLKELLSEKMLHECFWTYIEKAKKMGIRVISFWDDNELQEDRCYDTSIFLNEYGRKIFNNKLQRIIEEV